jgi:hypothetical protein
LEAKMTPAPSYGHNAEDVKPDEQQIIEQL